MVHLTRTDRIRRRRQRGAALVEAAVSIPFFLMIFLAMVFIGQLFVEKQRTISLSRQQAWTFAMQNCKGSMSDVNAPQTEPLDQGGGQGQDLSKLGQFQGAPGGDTASKGTSMASSTIQGQVATKNASGTGWTQNLQTTTTVSCNEEPIDGDLLGVLKFAWGIFTGW